MLLVQGPAPAQLRGGGQQRCRQQQRPARRGLACACQALHSPSPVPHGRWDAGLVRQLRVYLLRAAARPAGVSEELETTIQHKLGPLPPAELHQLLQQAISQVQQQPPQQQPAQQLPQQHQQAAQQQLPQQQQQQQQQQQPQVDAQALAAGLDHLLALFSRDEVRALLARQPRLIFAPLPAWMEFFEEFGFSRSQVKNLISQTGGDVLTRGTLVTAGNAIVRLRALGFSNDEIRHRVVAHTPQILSMGAQDVDMLIRLWAKFKVGVDERAGM